MADFARWCWLLDAQSGPFALTSLGSAESRRLEKSLVRYELDAPALAETSASLWRAGVFPTFADYLLEDEWTYLIGLDAEVVTVAPVAEALVHARSLSAEFFELIDHSAEMFLLERARGMWEVYSRHATVLDRLSRLVSVNVVESEHWLQSGG